MKKSKMFVIFLAVFIGLTFGNVTAIHAEEEDPATIESEEALSSGESQQEMGKPEEGMEIEAQSPTAETMLGEEGKTDQPSESESTEAPEGD